MKSLQRNDLRPVIYIVSTSPERIELAETATRNLDFIPLAFESFNNFFTLYDETVPGCVVLCMDEHNSDWLKMMDRIVHRYPSAQVVLLTRNWELAEIIKAIRHGAANVLTEPVEPSRMFDVLSEAIESDSSKRTALRLSIPESVLAQLDADEASIFGLLIQGRTTKQIASELDLSVRTIHYRKSSMFKKLGVSDRAEAVEMVRKIRRGKPMFDDIITNFPCAS